MTNTTHTTDDGQIESELHIDYLAAFDEEIEERTVDATVTRKGDTIQIQTPDNELKLQAREKREAIRLYSEYERDGYTHDNLAFIRYKADKNRIGVTWKDIDQNVNAIVLEEDAAYQLVLDMLAERRQAQDNLTVSEAMEETNVEIPALPLVVAEEQVSRGMTGRQTNMKSVVILNPESDAKHKQWEHWRGIIQRSGKHQLTHYKTHMWPPEGEGYEVGDQLTLHEYIDNWHAIDASDIATEAKLADIDFQTDLSVGNIVTVTNGRYRDDLTERQGVIRDVDESSADITWDGHKGRPLTRHEGQLMLGPSGMYSPVRELKIHDESDNISDELLEVRENVIESAEVDQQASSYDVAVERTWETSGGVEAEGASDLHAEVTVDGPKLDSPVTVHCRNIFDFGWTASIPDEIDEKTAKVIRRAARNNSPIPTGVRL
jgi:hypothetical protein